MRCAGICGPLRTTEENRSPVGRPVFKTGEGRQTSLVGSTPTLFRQLLQMDLPCRLRKDRPHRGMSKPGASGLDTSTRQAPPFHQC